MEKLEKGNNMYGKAHSYVPVREKDLSKCEGFFATFDIDAFLYDVFDDENRFVGSISSDEIVEIIQPNVRAIAAAAKQNALPAPPSHVLNTREHIPLINLLPAYE